MNEIMKNNFLNIGAIGHLSVSVFIHAIFLLYGELHDRNMTVKYTDVDYYVFSDAARYVTQGKSPYLRHTYRYTPIIAWMLVPNIGISFVFGKILFSIFDVLTGYMIYKCVRDDGFNSEVALKCALLWWYNPLPIIVSTRGNAESIMSLLVLLVILLLKSGKVIVASIIYGLSVHLKIYPIIYSLPIYLSLYNNSITLLRINNKQLRFILISVTVFSTLCFSFYRLYGDTFIDETYLYHITRKDIRHNFSHYFYLLYLTADNVSFIAPVVTFLPQVFLLILLSFRFYRTYDLPFCFFCQTFVFVTFNKVCTSQYFMWYLCLLPLVIPHLRMTIKKGIRLFLTWGIGQAVWLLPAYYLEMKGINTFVFVWLAGILFFIINIYVFANIMKCYRNDVKEIEVEKVD